MTQQIGLPKFSHETVAVVRGMSVRGDRQADIAHWHGISQATVNRIVTGKARAYRGIEPRLSGLPPPGPYDLVARDELAQVRAAQQARDQIIAELRMLLDRYTRGEADAETSGVRSRTGA